MKTLTRKISRTAITMALVILAFIAIFRAWVYYTESPWTRDARFSADVVAIAPDVAGLITAVNVHDNQLVKKDQVLFTIDQPRYQKALEEAEADVAYYQALASEKRREAGRRNQLGVQAMSREEIDQSNNVLQTVLHQLAKAQATRDLAKLDLERTVIRAPSDGWVTNLNVYAGSLLPVAPLPWRWLNRTPSTCSPIWKRPSWKACVRVIVRKSRRWAVTASSKVPSTVSLQG